MRAFLAFLFLALGTSSCISDFGRRDYYREGLPKFTASEAQYEQVSQGQLTGVIETFGKDGQLYEYGGFYESINTSSYGYVSFSGGEEDMEYTLSDSIIGPFRENSYNYMFDHFLWNANHGIILFLDGSRNGYILHSNKRNTVSQDIKEKLIRGEY